jgi:hypothetical protein
MGDRGGGSGAHESGKGASSLKGGAATGDARKKSTLFLAAGLAVLGAIALYVYVIAPSGEGLTAQELQELSRPPDPTPEPEPLPPGAPKPPPENSEVDAVPVPA